MGLERYVVDAVVLEKRSPREIAQLHGISRSWIYVLLARFHEGGYDALIPRSRRPRSCSHQTSPEIQAAIVSLRRELAATGHDAGAATIAHYLGLRFPEVPSVATIWRVLSRHGLVTPQPHKRPRSSFIRFEAALPNQMWQADITHWRLRDGTEVEILHVLDDHSRLLVASDTLLTVKAADVVETFHAAAERLGYPATFLSDDGAVFSGKSRQGKVLLESELGASGSPSSTPRPTTLRPAARSSASTKPSSAT